MQPTKNEKPKVDKPKIEKPKVDRPKVGEGIQRYFRNVMAELKKVNWPNRKELTTYTIVVIVTVLVVSIVISGWDIILTEGFRAMGFYRT